jgi:hypothetical protein
MALWTRGRDGHDPAGVVHHSISEYVGPVFLGFLTRTAMDATGCWYQEAPGLPDPHFRLTNAVLPRDLSVAREHLVRRLASPTV